VAINETRLAIKDDPTYPFAYNMQGLVLMELRETVLRANPSTRRCNWHPTTPRC
jgi:hypothetical protein